MQMNDNFENEIRRKLDGHSTEPPSHLWANIQAGIAPEERKRKPFVIWWLPLVFAFLVAGAAIIGNQVWLSEPIADVSKNSNSANNASSGIALATSATSSENADSDLSQLPSSANIINTDAVENQGSSAGNNLENNNSLKVIAKGNNAKRTSNTLNISGKNAKRSKSAYLLNASDDMEVVSKGPVKRFVNRLKAKRAAKRALKKGSKGSITTRASDGNIANNTAIATAKPDAFVKEDAPSFLNDTTPYIAKSDSVLKQEIKAALIEETKAEEKKKSTKPVYYDFFVQPRLTYNAVLLQSNNELLALELLNNANLTRRMGFDFGTRAVSFITPQWEVAYGFNFTYMRQDLSYRAQRLVKEDYQFQEAVNPNELRGINVPVLTQRNIENNLLLGGISGTTSLYLDKSRTLRITTGFGYQMPIVYRMRVSENEVQVSNENRPRAGNGVPSLMFGAGFRTRLTAKTSLILEPVATIYLRNTTTSAEPVRFRPYTVGLNAIIRFSATK